MTGDEAAGMEKEEVVRDDGRYVILYSSTSPDEPEEAPENGERESS
ncbi:Hypothetical Protein RradSPS_1821 [Rubrobacter radiotolerans]|uniref:Uncharacterized protein n=1 Tax=Rubrobacter radiotolerans TaxID=42256 RepID=A0A023X4Y4_RUBRA|nr:hypothetical protein [Rubrobacter radiotolerans]AHY47104.1 Hypothetical Protein RradSPS_1821 [Rubrobacter radiotolerans]MDX5894509.1 hypothetical protein [Rubrobacter radiotolerans]SMC06159.1 conserved hypothetical protein [Rubrobacter radiotolerans DSM 5868]